MAGAVVAPGVGAPIGGLIGLLAGMVVQKQVDAVTEKHERVTLAKELKTPSASNSAEPRLAPIGKPTRVWADETYRDGRLVVGAFEERYIP